MDGGTTFHFVTEGFDAAYSAACLAAGDEGVDIAGGASTVLQALIAGVIDKVRWFRMTAPLMETVGACSSQAVSGSAAMWKGPGVRRPVPTFRRPLRSRPVLPARRARRGLPEGS